MKGLSQAEQTPDFIVPNGLREPDLPANDQGITSPNTVFCAALGAWWMSIHLVGRSTGREWALLNWLLPLLLWSPGIGYLSPPFTVKFKGCHLFSPDLQLGLRQMVPSMVSTAVCAVNWAALSRMG